MTTRIYVSGHNMQGYMPESAPYLTTDWESACNSLVWDIESFADYLGQGLDPENADPEETKKVAASIEDCEEALDDLKDIAKQGPERYGYAVCYYLGDNSYWIEQSERASNEIPLDLEGDALEELIEKLNDSGY